MPPLQGYKLRFEVELHRCGDFHRVWTSRGTPCEQALTIWRLDVHKSKLFGSDKKKLTFGHTARAGFEKPDKKDECPAMYVQVRDRGGGSSSDLKAYAVCLLLYQRA